MSSLPKILFLTFQFFSCCTLVAAQSGYWLANIQRRGVVPYGNDTSYPVFRNVKQSYGGIPGAVGDGVTDDTEAVQNAIAFGYRCGGGDAQNGKYCDSSTTVPALVYFPPGTYRISKPIIMWYYTQLVGDAIDLPVLKGTSTLGGIGLLDSDLYIPGGSGDQWYQNQNNFYRQVRNFVIDLTEAPREAAGIHWQVAQATSLQNIRFVMRPKSESQNKQQGIFMENGSGGFMTDLIFIGGDIQMFIGNQQFTTRNLTFMDGNTAIYMNFNWLWTFHGVTISGCTVGIDMTSGGFDSQAVGSIVVLDSTIGTSNTGIKTSYVPDFSSPQTGGTLVVENVRFVGPAPAIANAGGRVILAGGQTVESFAQGNAWTTAGEVIEQGTEFNATTCTYSNTSESSYTAQESTIQQQLAPIPRPSNLVTDTGAYFARSKPQYEQFPATSFLSAKDFATGNGVTDDTIAVQNFLDAADQAGLIAYFDHGAYVISDTIQVPINLKITGELHPLIMATGPNFGDQLDPRPVFRVGNPGDSGTVEISELVFETRGPVPGAIMMQWNIKATSPGAAGMWDSHWRIGGTAGTLLQSDTCAKNPGVTTTQATMDACSGAFLMLHVTEEADFYGENTWGWTSDHELDLTDHAQINIYTGRGFLLESRDGPVWLWGTSAEHNVFYDYQIFNANNVFMGAIQHETAYYQGNPNALSPYTPLEEYEDPTYEDCEEFNCARTWAIRVINSTNIFTYGAGLYNFFENWNSGCLDDESCQERMIDIQGSSDIYLWAVSTKGSSFIISYEENPIVPQSSNKNLFCQTIVLFEMATYEVDEEGEGEDGGEDEEE